MILRSRGASPESCVVHLPLSRRAQERPGAGGARDPCAGECTRGGPQVSRTPGLPCAMVYGVLRTLPGERCTIAPVALQMAEVRGPAAHITTGLDAQTPGVRTTRLGRPRTSSLGLRVLACAHARSHAKTLSAPCRRRDGDRSRQSRPAIPITPDAVASIAARPAVRDDRDPPLVSGLGVSFVRQIRSSVKWNIFSKAA